MTVPDVLTNIPGLIPCLAYLVLCGQASMIHRGLTPMRAPRVKGKNISDKLAGWPALSFHQDYTS
jgi:hypothetical protein